MRVVILNTMDRSGGAARAAGRLNKGLQSLDIDSRMLVQVKTGNDQDVIGRVGRVARATARLRLLADQLPVIPRWWKMQGVFAPALLPGNAWRRANAQNADIIHMHWVTKAFLSIEDIARLNAPIVWTLHDMWPFTGGCHYDLDCERYRSSCGACPVLGSRRRHDLSQRILYRKHKAWHNMNMTIVSPSRWLADCARNSSLMHRHRIEVIPNGLDLDQFKPIIKSYARTQLSLQPDVKLILFGSMGPTENSRKGFSYLQSALRQLAVMGWTKQASVIVFGASGPARHSESDFPTRYIEQISDDHSLAALYSAADVFVAPSLQDNLPNTVMEALACGTPCVAFRIGGMPDMIKHRENGYLVEPRNELDLAYGISWVLEDQLRWQQLSEQSRTSVQQNYELTAVAKKYKALYEELLDASQTKHPARWAQALPD